MNANIPTPRITRRSALGITAAAAIAPLLASCAGSSEPEQATSGPVSVPVWSNAAEFTEFFAQRAAALNDSPYEYEITELQSSADDITTKALTAYSASGALPGLLGIEIKSFPRFMTNHIAAETLVDLTEAMGAPRDEFFEARVAPYTDDGKVYAMESQFPLVTLYKRTDLWEQYSIPEPETWTDYIRIGGEISERHGISLGVIGNADITWFEILLLQRGGGMFDSDGNLTIDSAEAVEALQLLVDGAENGTFMVVSDFYGGPGTSLLKQDRVAAYFMPDWFNTFILQANAPEQAGKWEIAPLPRFEAGGFSTSTSGGTGFAVSKDSPVRDAALLLLQDAYGTLDGQVDRFRTTGYLPTMKSAWDVPEVIDKTDDFLGGQRVMDIYSTIAVDAPDMFQSPNSSIVIDELETAIQSALTGRETAAQAIQGAAARAESQMAS
ncbi:ABC transporter substrate-binding protein [Ruania alba]|uniref:Multiple sugar transport system substrate-binding protein n=1 Tax=Ruania alba TaxID=648782 RepID=A0A1H5MIN6_9MICO|nr:extracellular solute-binding protein [Ruania alba]SEE89265.1 multiple sugar transport system substrate-binding protein [Ruania alba]